MTIKWLLQSPLLTAPDLSWLGEITLLPTLQAMLLATLHPARSNFTSCVSLQSWQLHRLLFWCCSAPFYCYWLLCCAVVVVVVSVLVVVSPVVIAVSVVVLMLLLFFMIKLLP